MDAAGEAISCRGSSGYGKPPWKFKGSAVYQFHLVKTEIARALTPKEFTLVEAFGYTLGGFFLAKYDDSPVGAFDELVVIAGLVWTPPTSCAHRWAAKVLVNSMEAWRHGRKHVGLPSHVASFSELGCCPEQTALHIKGKDNPQRKFSEQVGNVTRITFSKNSNANPGPDDHSRTRMGPSVKMSLPSFRQVLTFCNGRMEDYPSLLKYSCQMQCRLGIVEPVDIRPSSTLLPPTPLLRNLRAADTAYEESEETRSRLSLLVMLSKPVLALEFRNMEFDVEAPVVIAP
ncbi:NEOXANTHIN-DEFICIENT 1-like protein [Drosera capensis]